MNSIPRSSTSPIVPSAPRDGYIDRATLTEFQLTRFRALLEEIQPLNRFYAEKFGGLTIDPKSIRSADDFAALPFTTKPELLAEQEAHPPYGRFLTYPLARYSRMHQTSGTSGQPLRWLDTPQSWRWLLECWNAMYRMAGVREGDRLFFAFSFGPFLGFWTAFEAASQMGLLCLPGGGMSSTARLHALLDNQATLLLCTPTYALHLTEIARAEGIDLAGSSLRSIIVAGEPGGSVPEIRNRIEQAWGARVYDHNGMTEIGAVGIECPENPAGIHLLETEYITEVIDPATGRLVNAGHDGELVLTNVGRVGSPLIRYRTGDLVRVDPRPCPCGRAFVRLEGGILGRTDDMIHLRGNNFYPSALEALIRRFPEVAEYRVEVDESGPLAALKIDVEPIGDAPGDSLGDRIGQALRDKFLFRADVRVVPTGSLPRFEMKARRIVIKKGTARL
jgi:phenylacetate-CoA ligase